jgi:hypothetical protein
LTARDDRLTFGDTNAATPQVDPKSIGKWHGRDQQLLETRIYLVPGFVFEMKQDHGITLTSADARVILRRANCKRM